MHANCVKKILLYHSEFELAFSSSFLVEFFSKYFVNFYKSQMVTWVPDKMLTKEAFFSEEIGSSIQLLSIVHKSQFKTVVAVKFLGTIWLELNRGFKSTTNFRNEILKIMWISTLCCFIFKLHSLYIFDFLIFTYTYNS